MFVGAISITRRVYDLPGSGHECAHQHGSKVGGLDDTHGGT